jgi:hypothetical protein
MRRVLAAFLLYSLITIALTFPLALNLATAFPHDPGDPALNTWILWWNARAVPFTSTWWNAPAFYPVPGVLSFSENLLGLSAIATPIQWLGGSPLLGYNIVFLLTFPLCGLGAYLLALEITERHDAAFIAGLLFAFAPYRMSHVPHIQVLAAFGMPFALLGLHRYLRDPRSRWLALFGAGWLLQALCNGYYLLFFSVLVFTWVLWFVPPLSKPRTFRAIVLAGGLGVLPLLPLLWRYKTIHDGFGFAREIGTTRDFSADVLALFSTEPTLALWGWLQLYRRPEGQIFPGLAVVILMAAFAWLAVRDPFTAGEVDARTERRWRLGRRVLTALGILTALLALTAWTVGSRMRIDPVVPFTGALGCGILYVLTNARVRRAHAGRSVLGFYAVAAFVMWLLSLGPAPTMMGEPLMSHGPYSLLINLPGFSALRVPARFWMMSVLCLSVFGALVFQHVASRVPRVRRLLAGVIIFVALADTWVWTFPLAQVPPEWRDRACIPPASAGAVMELPLGEVTPDVGAMYRSLVHERPTVNGYSGYFPPHYNALRFGLALRDPDVLTQLAAEGVEYVVVNRTNREARELRRFVAAQPGVELVCTEEAHAVFRLQSQQARHSPKTPLPVASLYANVNGAIVGLMMDRDLKTRWDSGPQAEGMMLEIDLGTTRTVNEVEFALGRFDRDFPRGLRIEASEDRVAWREVWRGTSAGRAMVGALRDPAVVPLTYDLSSVNARYLRLWLTQNDDTYYWSVAEMQVFGQ